MPRVSSFELPVSASHNHLLRVLPVVGCRPKIPIVPAVLALPALPLSRSHCPCVAYKGRRSFLDAQDPPLLRRAAGASHAVPPRHRRRCHRVFARGRHCLSTPTWPWAPTKASPTAFNPDRARTSPEQAPPRPPSWCAADGHHRPPLRPIQPPKSGLGHP
jgi:hypothetical protein